MFRPGPSPGTASGLPGRGGPSLTMARPPPGCKITDRGGPYRDPLGPQQRPLQLDISPEAADPPGGGHDPVRRHIARAKVAHDVPDRPCRARLTRGLGHVAVRRDAARRDSPDDRDDAGRERRHQLSDFSYQQSAVSNQQSVSSFRCPNR